ncbi:MULTISPECIES: hypothetical protein [unclassified Bradyrhizobium]|uniref:hypothetical protein n=1 Tax=unclassified Bradyrhizobium TaxID=2631580 RepID=UPI002479B615|nr:MULTISPECIES: hypothetical protein [unclassified Bradyrhizobium]WGR74361.1 hypothetical protein MTX24_16685 [Bradyrhizobium sp. ISRA426]WGR79196.1 hypothetical protein MTX21_01800 [Bradyrhizobium sp. ISRA430]WGR90617.1 hypothetical protein MTX25_39610 [Bradyrhizobium sp. ISRA432]
MNGSKEKYLYQIDCQLRREKDATKRMQIGLLMAQIREGGEAVEPFLKRQVDLMLRPADDGQTH